MSTLELTQQKGIKIGEEKGIKIGEEKGIKIGEEKGIKIGEEKGIKIGEEKGRKVGFSEKELQVVINAYKQGIGVKTIAIIAGISVLKVKTILKKNKML